MSTTMNMLTNYLLNLHVCTLKILHLHAGTKLQRSQRVCAKSTAHANRQKEDCGHTIGTRDCTVSREVRAVAF